MADVTVVREIAPSARIAPGVKVGPFCTVGPNVTLGPRTTLVRRVSVSGHTTIGSENVFEDACVIGSQPQDLKYAGASTILVIGHRNRFGRSVTANVGTELGGFVTSIGDDNVLHDTCHIAHDCFVDDDTVMGCGVMLAGHVRVQSGAVIGDFSGLHHFVTIGRHARVGDRTPVRRDVPPFTDFLSPDYGGTQPAVTGVHEAGIAAAVLTREEENDLRYALRELFEDESALQTKIEQLMNMGVEGQVAMLCEFCQRSLRGTFGRHRELFRGETPPEAAAFESHLMLLRSRLDRGRSGS
jgi:UDP-N-acetylglucosamine acyltransferase